MSFCQSQGRSVVGTGEFPLSCLKSTWGQPVQEATGCPFRAEPRAGLLGWAVASSSPRDPIPGESSFEKSFISRVDTGHASAETGLSVITLQFTAIKKLLTSEFAPQPSPLQARSYAEQGSVAPLLGPLKAPEGPRPGSIRRAFAPQGWGCDRTLSGSGQYQM